jgi:hypothetical protein
MTGFVSKRQAAQAKLDNDTQVYADRKRGSIALARSLCYKINGAADDSDDMDGGGYGSVDIAEILSAEVVRLQAALAQPEQEPVAWVCFGAPGKRDIDFEEADINKLPIGTLLYTTTPAAQPEPPPEWEAINNILAEYGLDAIAFVAEWKATLWQAEPVAWGVFEGNLHDIFFTQEEAQEMADLKGTHAEVRPLYTAAAQPKQEPWRESASDYERGVIDGRQMQAQSSVDKAVNAMTQRPWQGLTEWEREAIAHACGAMGSDWLVFVEAVEKALKEKNK